MRRSIDHTLAVMLGAVLVAGSAGAAGLELSTGVLADHNIPWEQAYDEGWFVGVGSSFQVTENLDVIVGASYRHHRYLGGVSVGFAEVPEYHYSYTVVGEDSRSYEVHAGARLLGGRRGFRPIVALSAGAVILDQGAIDVTQRCEEYTEEERTVRLYHTGRTTATMYVSLAFGITVPVGDTGRLILESSVPVASEAGYLWIPLELTVQF